MEWQELAWRVYARDGFFRERQLKRDEIMTPTKQKELENKIAILEKLLTRNVEAFDKRIKKLENIIKVNDLHE